MTVILLSALSIIGLHHSVDLLLYSFTGKDLSVYWDMLDAFDSKWKNVLKPVIFCVYCMPSIWGTIFYFWWSFIYGGGVVGWIPSILAMAAIIHIFERLRNALD